MTQAARTTAQGRYAPGLFVLGAGQSGSGNLLCGSQVAVQISGVSIHPSIHVDGIPGGIGIGSKLTAKAG